MEKKKMDFNKNFKTYDKNAVVQRKAAKVLAKFLPENIGKYENILELGCLSLIHI